VTYEELGFLGDFRKFKVRDLVWNAGEGGELYYYELIDANGFLMQVAVRLRKTYISYDEEILQGMEGTARKKYEIFWLSEEFRSASHSNIHLWETPLEHSDLRFGNEFHNNFLQYGKIRYQYEEDILQYIVVDLEDVEIKIWGSEECPLSQYPTEGRSSMLSRMLNYTTARGAVEEFSAKLDGTYENPWEQPLTICLSAVGGAVIAAVATWLITYFIMRKKAKNATRLGANGENLALADSAPTDNPHADAPAAGESERNTPADDPAAGDPPSAP
jgi:hypothetical protein